MRRLLPGAALGVALMCVSWVGAGGPLEFKEVEMFDEKLSVTLPKYWDTFGSGSAYMGRAFFNGGKCVLMIIMNTTSNDSKPTQGFCVDHANEVKDRMIENRQGSVRAGTVETKYLWGCKLSGFGYDDSFDPPEDFNGISSYKLVEKQQSRLGEFAFGRDEPLKLSVIVEYSGAVNLDNPALKNDFELCMNDTYRAIFSIKTKGLSPKDIRLFEDLDIEKPTKIE